MSTQLAQPLVKSDNPKSQWATLAAGCFWSVELYYQRMPGVIQTQVGFTGGKTENPTYKQVCTGTTDHAEAVLLEYDPEVISYSDILKAFWKKHDPTQLNRQGNDIGTQYRSAIFYHTEEQKELATKSKEEHQKSFDFPIMTQILPATVFYPAEEYHQRYLEKGGQKAGKSCSDPIRCYG
ncbi:Peptide methionine sulfoxide reductase A2-1 [Zancudomyces culisetae]|uniref:peptide-methionine (S)-S-oxide reductase n=1 Tax=Zancudomyces culisetae TaxID=1213189 RepID=A0A1R1PHH0_ZANCU|nr:Peptide methionine sulfoxide reductase A2-1 [Zancudomyces culisetae]|eukprot:OMH80424.1 Peptide methionine sulfoxide reductase A2-1 [Zancudomyces culisetae]